MADLLKVLGDLRKSGNSDLHIFPGENCFTRRDGILSPMNDVKFAEDEVKKIILTTSSPKAREILGKSRQVNYSYDDPSGERYRFSVFFDKGKFALSIRLVPNAPLKFADLGLPEPIKKLLAKTTGLVIVGSPSGQGKSMTISAILDFINQHYEKNIITVENPVEIKYKDNRSSFIQRGIPLDIPNFYGGLNEAYKLDPDVVMTDSLSYRDVLDQALFLCEAGCMVIGATDGGDCQKILERIIFSRPKEERDNLKGRLVTHLSAVICQRLVPRVDMGRVAVFDIILNTQQIKTVIKGDNLTLLKNPQEQDHVSGMITYEKSIKQLETKLFVTKATVAAFLAELGDSAKAMKK